MPVAFFNNPSATVTSGGTTAPSPGTTENWTVSSVTGFPTSLSGGATFCLVDSALTTEKVQVNTITGSGPYTFGVTRGAEGTTPVAHTSGFTVQEVVTGGQFGLFSQTFNVRSSLYGAKGDGTTQDAAAVQAACTAAGNAGGGVVLLPAGTYLLTPVSATVPAVTVPSNVTIAGDGRGATVILKGGNGPLLDYSGAGPNPQTASWNKHQGLRDLSINGNSKTGLLLRLYYVQFYYEENVYLHDNADVTVDMAQCYDSRIYGGLYLYGGSTSLSAISGGQAVTHLIRNSAAPKTTLSAGISGTVTSLPVVALDAAMPAGIVQVWNGAGQVQNFTTTGAASAATSIPVSSVSVAYTFISGNTVNGFGWSSDSSNEVYFYGCHWEANLSGAIWIKSGVDASNPLNNIYFSGTKCEQSVIAYNAPLIQVDTGDNIQFDRLYLYSGGFNAGFSTPVAGLYFHPASGALRNVFLSAGGAYFSSAFDINVYWIAPVLEDILMEWGTNSPTVAGISVTGGLPVQFVHVSQQGSVSTPIAVSGGGSIIPDVAIAAPVQALTSSGTISTASGYNVLPVTETAAVTGMILGAPPTGGTTQITIVNRSAFTITFNATPATSHVADTADAIPASCARSFTYDTSTSLWYRSA